MPLQTRWGANTLQCSPYEWWVNSLSPIINKFGQFDYKCSPLSVMLISNLFLCCKKWDTDISDAWNYKHEGNSPMNLISSLTFRCESCTCHADSFGGFFWNLAAAHLWFTLLGMFFKRTAHLFSKCCTPQAPALRRLSYGNLWNLPSWWVNMPLSEYSDFVQYRLEF